MPGKAIARHFTLTGLSLGSKLKGIKPLSRSGCRKGKANCVNFQIFRSKMLKCRKKENTGLEMCSSPAFSLRFLVLGSLRPLKPNA